MLIDGRNTKLGFTGILIGAIPHASVGATGGEVSFLPPSIVYEEAMVLLILVVSGGYEPAIGKRVRNLILVKVFLVSNILLWVEVQSRFDLMSLRDCAPRSVIKLNGETLLGTAAYFLLDYYLLFILVQWLALGQTVLCSVWERVSCLLVKFIFIWFFLMSAPVTIIHKK